MRLLMMFSGCMWLLAACATSPLTTPGISESPTRSAASSAPLLVEDMRGRTHELDGYLARDEFVVLVFWQTWCASCLREAPALSAAARALGNRYHFVGVIPGPDEVVEVAEIERVVDKYGLPYPQVRDRDLALTERFGVEGTPTILVLGFAGHVLYRGHALPEDWSRLSADG